MDNNYTSSLIAYISGTFQVALRGPQTALTLTAECGTEHHRGFFKFKELKLFCPKTRRLKDGRYRRIAKQNRKFLRYLQYSQRRR